MEWHTYKVGGRVRHVGTRQWGKILEIVPQRDGTAEIKVQRDEPLCSSDTKNDPTWWASYHIGWHEPAADGKEDPILMLVVIDGMAPMRVRMVKQPVIGNGCVDDKHCAAHGAGTFFCCRCGAEFRIEGEGC